MDEYLIRYFPKYSPEIRPLLVLEGLHQFDLKQPC